MRYGRSRAWHSSARWVAASGAARTSGTASPPAKTRGRASTCAQLECPRARHSDASAALANGSSSEYLRRAHRVTTCVCTLQLNQRALPSPEQNIMPWREFRILGARSVSAWRGSSQISTASHDSDSLCAYSSVTTPGSTRCTIAWDSRRRNECGVISLYVPKVTIRRRLEYAVPWPDKFGTVQD